MQGFSRKGPKEATVVSAVPERGHYLDIGRLFGLQVAKGKLINLFGKATDRAVDQHICQVHVVQAIRMVPNRILIQREVLFLKNELSVSGTGTAYPSGCLLVVELVGQVDGDGGMQARDDPIEQLTLYTLVPQGLGELSARSAAAKAVFLVD